MSLIIKNVDKNGNDLPIRVYKDDKGKYFTYISKKTGEDYQNRPYSVEFLKDVSLENKAEIIIKHAFMTWFDWEYEGKSGTKYIIKIIAFDEVGKADDPVTPQNINEKWNAGKDITIPEEELPFY